MASVDLLNDILLEVLNCACTILESGICDDLTTASICGCPCRTFISAGPPVADLEACCSDGQLAVYVDRIYAFGNFPSQAAGFSPCSVPLAADIVVQLLRCFPVIHDDGSAPSHIELQNASEAIYRDLWLLTNGLLCCLAVPGRKRKFTFQNSRIIPPLGGCVGIEFRFSIELFSL